VKLVSVTLLGDGREDTIGAMVSSVNAFVDEVILIDTREHEDDALTVADVNLTADTPLHVVLFKWTGSFSDARNFALKVAADRGADWALMLDSDETLHDDMQHGDLRARLDGVTEEVVHFTLKSADGVYQQPRFFRLPVEGAFVGPTHEEYRPSLPAHVLEGVTFATPPKDPAQVLASAARDLPLLEAYVDEHPDDTRFIHYLGATHATLGNHLDAIEHFRLRADMGWGEEAAWSLFRCAVCWLQLKMPKHALDVAMEGMSKHAGLPELPYIAGMACLELQRWEQALIWGALAASLGKFARWGNVERVGQRSLVAFYEGPYEVVERAHKALGKITLAEEAHIHGIIARKHREASK
jgi:hypothetical protein